MNKITVIVPIYNVEKYLEKCMNSLINQTFKEFDIMAISDGSPDKSNLIMKKYQKIDSRIKFIEKENDGYGSVLEYAIKNINTDYVLICDPDDWLENDCLEVLYNVAQKNKSDIVIGEKYLVYNDSLEKKLDRINCKYFKLKNNYNYTSEVNKLSFISPSPHSKLYRTTILKNIIFPHKVSYTDFILFFIAIQNAKSVIYCDKPLSYYLIDRPGNTMTDKRPKVIKDMIIVWNSAYNQSRKDDKFLIFRLYDYYRMILKYYKINSDNLYKDEYYSELVEIRNILKNHYSFIKNTFDISIKEKIKMFLLLRTNIKLKTYISFKQ